MSNSTIQTRIPVRLKREPLIEAVWEIRFTTRKPAVGDLLPGFIFKALPDRYPNIVRLPVADIPAPIREHDPKLRYVPSIRLEGGNQAIQIGEHVVSLNCQRPYSGWKTFSRDIHTLINIVRDTGLIDRLERFSLKYIDLIELDQPPSLSCLNLELKMAGYEISSQPMQIRTEIDESDVTHIIQIMLPAEVFFPGESRRATGVLLDIDSVRAIKEGEDWIDLERYLDDVHWSSKKMFFSLLTPETIASLEPEYGGQRL